MDLSASNLTVHRSRSEPWRVTLVNTGANAMTGGRLAAVRQYLDPDEPFCCTYGDGVVASTCVACWRFTTVTGIARP